MLAEKRTWDLDAAQNPLVRHSLAKESGRRARTKTVIPLLRDRWFESVSLQRTVRLSPAPLSKAENLGFPRGCGRLGWRLGRQRRAGCFEIAPTGGNISVEPYSSTAVPLMGRRECHSGPDKVGAFASSIVR